MEEIKKIDDTLNPSEPTTIEEWKEFILKKSMASQLGNERDMMSVFYQGLVINQIKEAYSTRSNEAQMTEVGGLFMASIVHESIDSGVDEDSLRDHIADKLEALARRVRGKAPKKIKNHLFEVRVLLLSYIDQKGELPSSRKKLLELYDAGGTGCTKITRRNIADGLEFYGLDQHCKDNGDW